MAKSQQQKSGPKPKPVAPAAAAAPAVAAQKIATPAVPSGFFTREDWIAAATTFLISGSVYLYYMSPSVTLQDSGELVTGAYNFGVPHPPGYPLWAFLGWVWSHLVPFGNPAWRIGLMSVVTGALLVGIMTLLMTRSVLLLLRTSPWNDQIAEGMKHWIALCVGAAVSLIFAFNRGVWLWACVPEMRVLNVFLFIITTCLFFAWMMRPDEYKFLYATILFFGLGTTNHQTIAVMAVPFLVGALVVRPRTFFELAVAALFSAMAGFLVLAWLQTEGLDQFLNHKWFWRAMVVGAAAVVMLVALGARGLLDRRRALICTGLFLIGCSFYLYMPLASSTNPPMNWGYTATKSGFMHHITRGQYERLNIAKPLSREFFIQISLFTRAMVGQYTTGLALFALVTIAMWKFLNPRGRSWLIFVWAAFLTTSFGLLTIINPGLDKQQQEINIKFFAPGHGFFAMLMGYGVALAIGAVVARWKQLPSAGVRAGCVALLVLPAIPFARNWAICEQRHHDFGYQFGYRMFYPGDGYQPMERDAVLFGGTDPGRFVPTYMIFGESRVRPSQRFRHPDFNRLDVYIITQNALADSTYMSYIRDHYDYSRPKNDSFFQRLLGRDKVYPKEPIWIPSAHDLQLAFQQYLQELQTRPHTPEEEVRVEGGHVSVKGVQGVMAINGILTKQIFDRNRHKHAFYVEESYVIPWMFPYLEPFGIIMKINSEPLPPPEQAPALWAQIVARDRAYWDKLCADFLARPQFARDTDAQKTFSKQRSAIGGVYSFRKMAAEAEYAFTQALQLCPESPEANFRLAQLYVELNRFDDALALLEAWRKRDPLNSKIPQAIQQIAMFRQQTRDIEQLEQLRRTAPRDVQLVVRLTQAYINTGRGERIQPLLESYLAQSELTPTDIMQIAQVYMSMNQLDRSAATLRLLLERYPEESAGYYALAIVHTMQAAVAPALDSLQRAIELSPQLREMARSDVRFNNIRSNPRFQQIVNPAAARP